MTDLVEAQIYAVVVLLERVTSCGQCVRMADADHLLIYAPPETKYATSFIHLPFMRSLIRSSCFSLI